MGLGSGEKKERMTLSITKKKKKKLRPDKTRETSFLMGCLL